MSIKAKTVLCIAAIALLSACGKRAEDDRIGPSYDQCLRAEIFQACLKSLPAGPQAAKYNDWDEVVDACERAAYYQSLRTREAIKPECRN